MTRRALLAAAVVSSLVAIALDVSGGLVISAGGLRLSARSPRSAMAASFVLAGAWLIASARARALATDLAALSTWQHAS